MEVIDKNHKITKAIPGIVKSSNARNERDHILNLILEELNKDRSKKISHAGFNAILKRRGFKGGLSKLKDNYYQCKKSSNFNKCFWGKLKNEVE